MNNRNSRYEHKNIRAELSLGGADRWNCDHQRANLQIQTTESLIVYFLIQSTCRYFNYITFRSATLARNAHIFTTFGSPATRCYYMSPCLIQTSFLLAKGMKSQKGMRGWEQCRICVVEGEMYGLGDTSRSVVNKKGRGGKE